MRKPFDYIKFNLQLRRVTTFLISLFDRNPLRPADFSAFRSQRLALMDEHGGRIVALFRPEGADRPEVPDEIHILAFRDEDICTVFRARANRLLPEGVEMHEFQSETLIPEGSVLAALISEQPPVPLAPAPVSHGSTQRTAPLSPPNTNALDTAIQKPRNRTQERLGARVQQWQAEGDRRVIFAHTYYLMTANMLDALQAGAFHDPEWVTRLLERFAGYYFAALEKYEADPFSAPSVWRVAFQVAENQKAFALQHLLLGVNAHINNDLPLALIDVLKDDWPALSKPRVKERYEDHTLVNKTIATTFDQVQEQIIARYAPTLDVLQNLTWEFDDLLVSSLIHSWREHAWRHAAAYLNADSWEEKHAVLQEAEYLTLRRADVIMLRQGPARMKLLF